MSASAVRSGGGGDIANAYANAKDYLPVGLFLWGLGKPRARRGSGRITATGVCGM
jgi:hypothetical protein